MLFIKRKIMITAILAALPSLALAQSLPLGVTVNPADSGYHMAITENPVAGPASPASASAADKMGVTVNPEDSGYHMAVTENPVAQKKLPAAPTSRASDRQTGQTAQQAEQPLHWDPYAP